MGPLLKRKLLHPPLSCSPDQVQATHPQKHQSPERYMNTSLFRTKWINYSNTLICSHLIKVTLCGCCQLVMVLTTYRHLQGEKTVEG